MFQIVPVLAVTAVFILNLHHDHRPARRIQMLLHHRQHLVQIAVVRFEERGVGAAEIDPRLHRKPRRQAAVLPLGADIRAGPDDRIPGAVNLIEKTFEVEHAGKIEFPLVRFMQIVAQIGFDRIEPHHLRLFDPVAPQLGMYAKIVDRAGDHLHRLAVDPDCPAGNFNFSHLSLPLH